jgi:ribosomal protein S18 acetylase RimI-like enzyme
MSFFTRTITSTDFDRCKQMLLDIFGVVEVSQFLRAWNTRNEIASFGLLSNNQIIGYILLDIYNKIQYLCVDPAFRNARLGSTLLQTSLDFLLQQGVKEITLTTAKDARLTKWYANFGFVVVNNVYDEYGDYLGADMVLTPVRHTK